MIEDLGGIFAMHSARRGLRGRRRLVTRSRGIARSVKLRHPDKASAEVPSGCRLREDHRKQGRNDNNSAEQRT